MSRQRAIAILIVLAVVPALAQPGLVRGRVTDENGAPVRDAVATFQAEGSQTQREAMTDAKGEFLLVGLDTARYKITIAKEGFVPDVVTAGIARENNPLLEFRLTSAKAASSKAATVVSEGPAIPVSPGLTAAGADPKAAAALLALAKTAVEALNAGRNGEAVTAFTEIVASAPACSDCYVNLGIAHVNKKEYPQAEAAFKKAIQIKTDHAEAYERLASVYSAQKKFDLAADANRNAAALIGGAQAAAGGGGNFAALYNPAATGGGGGNFAALYNQGVALFNGGKFAEAKTAFEAATKADPKMAMAQYHLGISAVNIGDFALAVRAFERYLQLDPNGEKAAEIKASLPALKGMVKK
jgi:tetratricopeptide (TPR) repeat protein